MRCFIRVKNGYLYYLCFYFSCLPLFAKRVDQAYSDYSRNCPKIACSLRRLCSTSHYFVPLCVIIDQLSRKTAGLRLYRCVNYFIPHYTFELLFCMLWLPQNSVVSIWRLLTLFFLFYFILNFSLTSFFLIFQSNIILQTPVTAKTCADLTVRQQVWCT